MVPEECTTAKQGPADHPRALAMPVVESLRLREMYCTGTRCIRRIRVKGLSPVPVYFVCLVLSSVYLTPFRFVILLSCTVVFPLFAVCWTLSPKDRVDTLPETPSH